jgi:hypothetical protein
VFYDATRKLVLRGADGVVFVADSQNSMRDSNLDSLENLKTNLRINRLDPEKVALVFQYNKRDLPNVDSVDDMSAYLQTNGAPVVEAQALNGVGVTATLRAAVSRILENLKNNVDTTLADAPELEAPDLSVKSGVTSMSAGIPKLSMKDSAAPVPPPAAPLPLPPPQPMTPAVFENAFAAAPSELEDDPFGAVAVVEDDPFAERAAVEALLSGARRVVSSLETALEAARAHERDLARKLDEL